MPETYYQSAHTGQQIDNAISRIASGEFDMLAEDAVSAGKTAVNAAATAAGCEAGAQQAWTGVQTAIKNIPSGSTPIVNDLTTGGTRMALSAEMGKVLGQRPNPNLIDNGYFLDPINQRGQTQYTGGVYTIDRWKIITSATTVTCGSDGVSVYTATASLSVIRQDIELSNLDNRIVTLSMLLADGVLCTDSGNTNGVTASTTSILALADGSTAGRYAALFKDEATGRYRVQLKAPTGVEMKVVAVKLEFGDTQTLAHLDTNGNWVLNEIPNYQQELAKCQRYFYRMQAAPPLTAMSIDTTTAPLSYQIGMRVELPVPMRANPTLTVSKLDDVYITPDSASNGVAPTMVELFPRDTGHRMFNLVLYATVTVGKAYAMGMKTGGYLDFDANL